MRIKGTGASAGSDIEPRAFDYSVTGRIVNAIAGSTPESAATMETGNLDAANPVVGPDASHAFASAKGDGAPRGERGLAMALAGNGRWCYLDPKLGAMHAVAEAARKVACTGATPVSATNCLNFGNPEKPEIMAQLSAAIDGIAEACSALGTPITGGNVSLYNETKGVGIYPTPVVGIVGIIDDVTKAVPSGLSKEDELILILGAPSSRDDDQLLRELGSSEFAKVVLGETWGVPPALDLENESKLHKVLAEISAEGLVGSAQDVSSGGIAVALAKLAISRNIGIYSNLSGWKWTHQAPKGTADTPSDGIDPNSALFGEHGSMVVVSGTAKNIGRVIQLAKEAGIPTYPGGTIMSDTEFLTISNQNPWADGDPQVVVEIEIADIRKSFLGALESQIAEELVTA
jgi:phosphoribosylformylglycinamidine synthase